MEKQVSRLAPAARLRAIHVVVNAGERQCNDSSHRCFFGRYADAHGVSSSCRPRPRTPLNFPRQKVNRLFLLHPTPWRFQNRSRLFLPRFMKRSRLRGGWKWRVREFGEVDAAEALPNHPRPALSRLREREILFKRWGSRR